jgi:hypothetical protein
MKISSIGFILLLMLSSCFSRPGLMTEKDFAAVQIGMPYSTIEKDIGQAYTARVIDQHTVEYEYIERVQAGNALVAENHYYILVKDGKVVSKRFSQETAPAYDIIYSQDPNFTPS